MKRERGRQEGREKGGGVSLVQSTGGVCCFDSVGLMRRNGVLRVVTARACCCLSRKATAAATAAIDCGGSNGGVGLLQLHGGEICGGAARHQHGFLRWCRITDAGREAGFPLRHGRCLLLQYGVCGCGDVVEWTGTFMRRLELQHGHVRGNGRENHTATLSIYLYVFDWGGSEITPTHMGERKKKREKPQAWHHFLSFSFCAPKGTRI
jgi:hypothetical protein